MAVMPNMDRDRTDRPSARPRMTRKAGGVQDSGQGGRIPSPRQSYDEPSRRPSSAGGDRDARNRAVMMESYMRRPEMGSTVPGEGMNRPAMDINDAFFGPDRKPFQWTDIIDFLMNRSQGGR